MNTQNNMSNPLNQDQIYIKDPLKKYFYHHMRDPILIPALNGNVGLNGGD